VSAATASRLAPTSVGHAGLSLTAAFALASIVTQAYWLATGDAFGLGLVSGLNPTGIGNLPTFAITAALACCAGGTAILAAALRVQRAPGWLAVALLATGCALLSLEQLAVPTLADELDRLDAAFRLPPGGARSAVLAAVAIALASVVMWAWRHAGPARARLASGAIAFAAGCLLLTDTGAAALQAWLAPPQLAAAIAGIYARTLQLGGVLLATDAIATWLSTVSPEVRIVTDDAAPHALAVTPLPLGMQLTIGPRRLARAIGAVIVLLVVASLLSGWTFGHWQPPYRLHRLFDLDRETNVPTWWSAMLLLASGVVASCQASTEHRAGDRRWLDWLTLGALFIALATDEAAGLHELLVKPLRALLGAGGWLHYPLIVPGTVIGIALAVRFRGFLRTLGPTRWRLTRAAAVFALGAFGFETVGGWYAPETIGPNATYIALSTIEETLEMLGSTLALLALLRHVRGWRMTA